jgi:anti-sigma factor RsiW
MKCSEVQSLLQPYSDRELDLVRQLQIEEHLTGCDACAQQETRLRALRAAVSSPSLYYRAPDTLRSRIQLATRPIQRGWRRPSLQLAAIAATILFLIGTAATLGILSSRAGASADDRVAQWVVAAHIRSLQADHLMDVASTDQHTVKPWFRGKVDFSPEVPDLSAQGFELSGGRLDYLADHPVAALVYRHRLHAINLFIWPADNDEDKAVRDLARQGFHIRHWQRAGMTYWAISDLSDQGLNEFVRLFQENSHGPPT